jgi:predicted lipoprotein
MRQWTAFLMAAAMLFAVSAGAQAEDEQGAAASAPGALVATAVPQAMAQAVDGFIRPGYRDFVEETGTLADHFRPLCHRPSPRTLARAKRAFSDAAATWARIEIVRVGPVLDGNRFERVLFFPDRKSTGLKQVQKILSENDPTATVASSLRSKSVAVQGLGALEYVLFGTDADELLDGPDGFRCRYGLAIADNLTSVAAELSAAWEKPNGIQAAWKTPGPNNPLYRTPAEAATELLGILVHGVESLRDQRLRPVFAGAISPEPAPGHPKLALFWRSNETMPTIAANARGLKALFDTSGMRTLLPPDKQSVAASIDTVFNDLIGSADAVDQPIDKALTDPAERAKLLVVLRNTNDLLQRLNLDFGAAIGLGAGFSFADGD